MMKCTAPFLRPLAMLLSLTLAGCALPHNNGSQVQFEPMQKGTFSKDTDQRLADSALASGNPEMAISLYKKILTSTPTSLPALDGLGSALFQTNELQQSREVFLQMESVAPLNPDAELGLARISLHEHQMADAIARYQGVLQRTPDNLAAAAGLGVAYDIQGRHDLAQATYRQGLLLHPQDLNLRNDLGLSLVLSNHVRAGIEELLSIADDPSAPPQTRENLALGYGLLGNNAAAERVLQADLPQVEVQSNLQYYKLLRTRMALHSKEAFQGESP